MHEKRRWCVSTIATPEELARMLTERTWTLCSGFTVAGHDRYVFLNDATSEDGAGEFGVIVRDGSQYRQIESITFSWCGYEDGLRYILQALAGEMDRSDFARPVTVALEVPEQHRRCHLCA